MSEVGSIVGDDVSFSEREDDENLEGEIKCICGFTEDDGFTIQCEKCFVWQHIICIGIDKNELPEVYYCDRCDPRPLDAELAKSIQAARLASLVAPNSSGGSGRKPRGRPPSNTGNRQRNQNSSVGSIHNSRNQQQHFFSGMVTSASSSTSQLSLVMPPDDPSLISNYDYTNSFEMRDISSQTASLAAFDSFAIAKEFVLSSTENNLSTSSSSLSKPSSSNNNNNKVADSNNNKKKSSTSSAASTGDFNNFAAVQVRRIRQRGYQKKGAPAKLGLFADQTIQADQVITEFVGEVQTKDYFSSLFSKRGGDSYVDCTQTFVLFHPVLNICVDSRKYGNSSRYMRRSCRPNAEIRLLVSASPVPDENIEKEIRFLIIAKNLIHEGEEIVVDMDYSHGNRFFHYDCACGNPDFCLASDTFIDGPITIHAYNDHLHPEIDVTMVPSTTNGPKTPSELSPQAHQDRKRGRKKRSGSEVASNPDDSEYNSSSDGGVADQPVTPGLVSSSSLSFSGVGVGGKKVSIGASSLASLTSPTKSVNGGGGGGAKTPTSASGDTPTTSGLNWLIDASQNQKKLSREERKILQYMESFEKMEMRQQKKKQKTLPTNNFQSSQSSQSQIQSQASSLPVSKPSSNENLPDQVYKSSEKEETPNSSSVAMSIDTFSETAKNANNKQNNIASKTREESEGGKSSILGVGVGGKSTRFSGLNNIAVSPRKPKINENNNVVVVNVVDEKKIDSIRQINRENRSKRNESEISANGGGGSSSKGKSTKSNLIVVKKALIQAYRKEEQKTLKKGKQQKSCSSLFPLKKLHNRLSSTSSDGPKEAEKESNRDQTLKVSASDSEMVTASLLALSSSSSSPSPSLLPSSLTTTTTTSMDSKSQMHNQNQEKDKDVIMKNVTSTNSANHGSPAIIKMTIDTATTIAGKSERVLTEQQTPTSAMTPSKTKLSLSEYLKQKGSIKASNDNSKNETSKDKND